MVSDASFREMTDSQGEWYGLGTINFSDSGLGWGLGVGHTGQSSPPTCCSEIVLTALPEEGVVILVQANFPGDLATERRAFYAKEFATEVPRLSRLLSDAATA